MRLSSRRDRRPRVCVCPVVTPPMSILGFMSTDLATFFDVYVDVDPVSVDGVAWQALSLLIGGITGVITDAVRLSAGIIRVSITGVVSLGDAVVLAIPGNFGGAVGSAGEVIPAGDYMFNGGP